MPIAFDRNVCCDLNETISREWLVSNGLGGYAAGTVAGVLTRMQHGLLVASPLDGTTPQLLLAKIDEEVVFDQRTYYLGTNEYRDGTLNPSGFAHLETFHLEEGFPIFTYRLGGIDGIMLEKRIWMPHGQNTTYIRYRVLRTTTGEPTLGYTPYPGYAEEAQRILELKLLPFSAYRPHQQPQYGKNDWHFQVDVHSADQDANEDEQNQLPILPKGIAGCTIRAWDGAHPYHIVAVGHAESQTTFIPTGVWYWHFLRRHDQAAGRPSIDDLYLPGVIRTKLWPGEDSILTIIVTAEELSSLTFNLHQLNLSYKRCVDHQRSLLQPQRYFGEGGETAHQLRILPLSMTSGSYAGDEEYLRLLLQASERFLARRTLPQSKQPGTFFNEPENMPLLLSDYYDMEDSIRDTLIALPGLTLATGCYDEALRILRSLARYFKQGMLPDRLPSPGHPLEERDYGSVDTTLWYFYALDHYLRTTRAYEFLEEVYQRLVDSINWYIRGTYNGIQVDARDGLLRAQEPGKALTWMNASVNDIPITPRQGKPVEVNALWYHALSLMHEWSQHLYHAGHINHISTCYQEQSTQCKRSFQQRFWYAAGGYLYDVVGGPDGNDTTIRPNQLLAFSLRYPVLDREYRQTVFELVTQQLVTPYGLRTLASQEAGYCSRLNENQEDQQRALHQGSAWPWLIGPYIDAMFQTQGLTQDESLQQEHLWRKGLLALEPFREHLNEGILGMIGGVFDGDAPQRSGYKIASALSVGEILRVYKQLAHMSMELPDLAPTRDVTTFR